MALFGLFKNYGGVKLEQAEQAITEAMVNADAAGFSEAELRQMNQELDKLLIEKRQLEQKAEKEAKDVTEIEDKYNARRAGIKVLQTKLATETDPGLQGQLAASIEKQVTQLEAMLPEIAREKKEANAAAIKVERISTICENLSKQIKGYKQAVSEAKNRKDIADMDAQIAKDEAAQEARLNGLTGSMNKMTVALNALNAAADKAEVEAAAVQDRNKLFGTKEEEDPLFAAAMKEATGQKPTASLEERLAALDNRQ